MVILTLRQSRLWGNSRLCMMARQRPNLHQRILKPLEFRTDVSELIWIFNISKYRITDFTVCSGLLNIHVQTAIDIHRIRTVGCCVLMAQVNNFMASQAWKTLIRINYDMLISEGTAVAQWLRCCATNRKVAGSIPHGVIGIFHWRNPSDRTMALWSTQPLTEMSTRSISWG